MYSFPSTSKMWEPWPRAMNGGLPPTERNARTGELTPPGMISSALRNNSSDLEWFMFDLSGAGAFACRVETGLAPMSTSGETRTPCNSLSRIAKGMEDDGLPDRYPIFPERRALRGNGAG